MVQVLNRMPAGKWVKGLTANAGFLDESAEYGNEDIIDRQSQ